MARGGESWPEPSPDFTSERTTHWTWLTRRYGFGTVFLLVSLWATFILIKDRRTYPRKLHSLFMNVLLLITSISRSATFFSDPLANTPPSEALFITYKIATGMGTGCIVSAYSILLLILLDTTSMKLAPPRFQKLKFLLGVTAVNFVYLVIAYVVVLHRTDLKLMVLLCQVLLSLWGLVICLGYAITGGRLYRNLKSSRKLASGDSFFTKETRSMKRLGLMLGFSSINGAALFIVRVYYAASEYGVLNHAGMVPFWPWFGFNVGITVLELSMCVLVFVIALKACARRQGARVNVQNRTATTEQLKMRTRAVTSTAADSVDHVIANLNANRVQQMDQMQK